DRIHDATDYLVTDADRDAWRRWVSAALRKWTPEGGWTAKPDETDEQREMRAMILEMLSYGADDPQIVAGARELASRYIDDPKSLDATLADTAIGIAVRHGDAALFDRILAAWRSAKNPEQR